MPRRKCAAHWPTRSDLVAATAKALSGLVASRGWLSAERMTRILRESADRAHLIIAADIDHGDGFAAARALAAHLRTSGQLTPSLVLRAILSGNRPLFEAAMVELSGLHERKALGLARQRGGNGFAALYRAANMPLALLPAFQAGVEAMAEMPGAPSARLSRAAIHRVLAACEAINEGELNALLALLRRFEAEAARENAREAAVAMRAPDVQLLPSFDPYSPPPVSARRIIEIDLVKFEADLAA